MHDRRRRGVEVVDPPPGPERQAERLGPAVPPGRVMQQVPKRAALHSTAPFTVRHGNTQQPDPGGGWVGGVTDRYSVTIIHSGPAVTAPMKSRTARAPHSFQCGPREMPAETRRRREMSGGSGHAAGGRRYALFG